MTLPPDEARILGGDAAALTTWEALRGTVLAWPGVTLKLQASQIGLWAGGHPFAAVWTTAHSLGRAPAPLVLSLFARQRLDGAWKEVVMPAPGRFTHHIELTRPEDLTPRLLAALQAARQGVA